ncbi:MAG: DUF4437 domain-containing protein [Pseudomonadales bacterium]
MARPHIEPFCDRDVHFKTMMLPGFGFGMRYKMLSLDSDNGSCSMTVQLDAGYSQKPGFSWSELEVIIVEGEIKIGDKVYRKGHYFFLPAGYCLEQLSSEKGALLMYMYNTGEPSHVEATEHHQLCRTAFYHDVDSYMDLAWVLGNVTKPTVATGCLIKLLNFNVDSHALTFLYCMTPNFYQDNISYHDCAEESYHLWGTSWMMQFGDVPTGGYFWRPAYINHGAFASEQGCIALGRTDSKLFNHFHYNPWSTPGENQDRSVARLAKRDPLLYKWTVDHAHNHPHGPEDFEETQPTRGEDHDHEAEKVSDGHTHGHWHGDEYHAHG